jgi:hypothetical protein
MQCQHAAPCILQQFVPIAFHGCVAADMRKFLLLLLLLLAGRQARSCCACGCTLHKQHTAQLPSAAATTNAAADVATAGKHRPLSCCTAPPLPP